MASESFIHALLLFFMSFSQNFPLGAPESSDTGIIFLEEINLPSIF